MLLARVPMVQLGIFLAWSLPVLASLNRQWWISTIENGYPVVAMAVYLAVLAVRDRVPGPLQVDWRGLLVFAATTVLIAFAIATDVQVIFQFVWPLAALAFAWSLGGPLLARRLIPAAGMLYFTIPIWLDFYAVLPWLPTLTQVLQALTTAVTSTLLELSGIPAFIDGNSVELSVGTFEIVEGCSGRAYFLVAIELAYFYCFFALSNVRHRLVFGAIAAVLALLTNWLRVYIIIVIGYTSDMQHSLVYDHETFGWLLYFLVVVPLLLAGRWFENRERHSVVPSVADTSTAYTVSPHLVTAVAALAIVANFVALRINVSEQQVPASLAASEWSTGEWAVNGEWQDKIRPLFPGAETVAANWVSNGTARLGVALASYSALPIDALDSVTREFPPDFTLHNGSSEIRDVALGDGKQIEFAEFKLLVDGRNLILWQGFKIGGIVSGGGLPGRFLLLAGRMSGRPDAQVLVMVAHCETDCVRARQHLADYARKSAERLLGMGEPRRAEFETGEPD